MLFTSPNACRAFAAKVKLAGSAPAGQATVLAREVADGNHNAMQLFGALGGQMNPLQGTGEQAFSRLDQLSGYDNVVGPDFASNGQICAQAQIMFPE